MTINGSNNFGIVFITIVFIFGSLILYCEYNKEQIERAKEPICQHKGDV